MKLKLKELIYGMTSASEEARRDDFTELYFDYNDIIEKTLKPEIYLVLGRRGTGKSMLSFMLVKSNKNSMTKIERISYSDLNMSNFSPIKNTDDDLFHVFQWLFLIELSKQILKNESLNEIKEYKLLKTIYDNNFNFFKSTGPTLLQRILNRGVALNLPIGLGLELGQQEATLNTKDVPLIYEKFKDLLSVLLLKSAKLKQNYILLIDDIDDHIRLDASGLQIFRGLLTSIQAINNFIRDYSSNSKIILFLRTDIFSFAYSNNSNRLLDDNSITLNWMGPSNYKSPLFQLFFTRLKVIYPEYYSNMENKNIYNDLFAGYSSKAEDGGSKIDKYILNRTMNKPRDFIKYLNLIRDHYQDETVITAFAVADVESEYSRWVFTEIRNEMRSNLDNGTIHDLFDMLKKINSTEFNLTQVQARINRDYPSFTLEKGLELLYQYGVIGCLLKIKNPFTGLAQLKDTKYNKAFIFNGHESLYLDSAFLSNTFEVHKGLRHVLSNNPHHLVG